MLPSNSPFAYIKQNGLQGYPDTQTFCSAWMIWGSLLPDYDTYLETQQSDVSSDEEASSPRRRGLMTPPRSPDRHTETESYERLRKEYIDAKTRAHTNLLDLMGAGVPQAAESRSMAGHHQITKKRPGSSTSRAVQKTRQAKRGGQTASGPAAATRSMAMEGLWALDDLGEPRYIAVARKVRWAYPARSDAKANAMPKDSKETRSSRHLVKYSTSKAAARISKRSRTPPKRNSRRI